MVIMKNTNGDILVDPQWLSDHKEDESLVIVDCVSDKHEYMRAHIPTSIMRLGPAYVKSIDSFGNRSLYITSPKEFDEILYKMGIGANSIVICYDSWGSYYATRFFWALTYYGHSKVKILDGGWQNWISSSFPISIKSTTLNPPEQPFKSSPNNDYLISLEELNQKYNSPDYIIIDTRSKDEYTGNNTRGNKRCGHVPGAILLEWSELMENSNNREAVRKLLPRSELEEKLSGKGITKDKIIVTYCQSAIRAAHTAFVLKYLGYPNVRLYDGSMSEWANNEHTPLEI
jgi:thiosulfate/3-mercaptopyruvate sulfurtransferase